MDKRDIIRSMIVAFAAQGFSMVLSVLQSLLVPKLLGVTEYGYWQLFIFYSGYVGFFHLGLNDGVYLLKGGETRDVIDKRSVNSQFIFSLAYQAIFSIGFVLIALFGNFGADRSFVIIWAAVFLIVQNAASYLMYVLQAMNETRLSSYSMMVNRGLFIVALLALLIGRETSYRPFIITFTLAAVIQLVYCAWYCRDILASGFSGWKDAARESASSIRVGIKLMLANIASMTVLGVVRFAVDAAWGIESFGKLSLSLSLANFFLAFVTQAAMVLFPALRQSKEGEIRSFFVSARDGLGLLLPAIYLAYFPLVWVLGIWLPTYADSLAWFAWLIPICIFDAKMSIECTTLFKVRREEGTLLLVNVVTVLCCTVLVVISVWVLGSMEAAVMSATIAITARSIASELLVSRELEIGGVGCVPWELGLSIAFLLLAFLLPAPIACVGYAFLYALYLWLHRGRIRELTLSLRRTI